MKRRKIAFACALLIMKFSYAQNTFPATGNVGIGTTSPRAVLDVSKYIGNGTLGTALARQSEGDAVGQGTYLGVKAWDTQDTYNGKSFSLEHHFYGDLNSSINFYRGGGTQGGYITFGTYNGTERMRIGPDGNVGVGGSLGVGMNNPGYKLDVSEGLRVGANNPGGAMLAIADDAVFYDDQNSNLRLRMIYGGSLQIDNGGLTTTGKVGIGTANPQSELAVKGTITSMKVKVTQTGWADYVFDSSYNLAPLSHVEKFIRENKHLPEVPSATEVKKRRPRPGRQSSGPS